MINVSELPKNPVEALKSILQTFLTTIPNGNAQYSALRAKNHSFYQTIVIARAVAKKVLQQIGDAELAELINASLQFPDDQTLPTMHSKIETCLNAILAIELEEHFFDNEEFEKFNNSEVPQGERDEIRACLQKARDLAANATFLTDRIRLSFLAKVSRAESELFKEKVGMEAFFSVAYESSRLLRRYGEDAKEIAEAIETARTKTERHVQGYEAIEADEKPKQITGPSKKD